MKTKNIFILLSIMTGVLYCVSLISYIMTKQFIDLIFSAISGILTVVNLYTIYKINKRENSQKRYFKKDISKDNSCFDRYAKNDIKLTKSFCKNLNKKNK